MRGRPFRKWKSGVLHGVVVKMCLPYLYKAAKGQKDLGTLGRQMEKPLPCWSVFDLLRKRDVVLVPLQVFQGGVQGRVKCPVGR